MYWGRELSYGGTILTGLAMRLNNGTRDYILKIEEDCPDLDVMTVHRATYNMSFVDLRIQSYRYDDMLFIINPDDLAKLMKKMDLHV